MFRPTVKDEASPLERASYVEAGLETQAGLEEAIRLLTLQRAATGRPEARRRLSDTVHELRAALDGVRTDLVDYLADGFRMAVPDEAELAAFKSDSRTLFRMMPGQESEDVLVVAGRLAGRWARTRPRRPSLDIVETS